MVGRTACIQDSDPIPFDLTFEILIRLPAKSLVRFQCVSKPWSSIIRRQDFNTSFLSRSSAQPYLVNFIIDDNNAYTLFSVPALESSFIANHGLKIPKRANPYTRLNSFHGLLCFEDDSRILVCNPTTRQLIPIPLCESMTVRSNKSLTYNDKPLAYLGYDVVSDQYKVLRTSMWLHNGSTNDDMISEHHIFVLGAGNPWRSIKGTVPYHYPELRMREVYVNKVLYYGASLNFKNRINSLVIVRFDFTSEEFNFIKVPAGICGLWDTGTAILVNHEEKVTLVEHHSLMIKELDYFDLWVLEDVQKGQWSKMIRVTPPGWHCIAPSWRDIMARIMYFHNIIHTGEIVAAEGRVLFNTFCVLYCDIKKNSIRRFEIKGLPGHDPSGEHREIEKCLDHFENIMFLEDCSLPGIVPETLHEILQ